MSCFQYRPKGKALQVLQRHLPTGILWLAFWMPSKNCYKLLDGLAQTFELAWAALCNLAIELNPFTTRELIEEWETAVSIPDECFPNTGTIEERRNRVLFKLSPRRWTTIEDWLELAEMFGLEVKITPGWLVQKEALFPQCFPIKFYDFPKLGRFRIYIDFLNAEFDGFEYEFPVPFQFGSDATNEFRCLISKIKPANTVVIFNAFPELCDS